VSLTAINIDRQLGRIIVDFFYHQRFINVHQKILNDDRFDAFNRE
jgi:hypothetical protein